MLPWMMHDAESAGMEVNDKCSRTQNNKNQERLRSFYLFIYLI